MSDKKRPTHNIFAPLPRGEGKKAFWVNIGSAWENADGSLNLKLELIPRDPNVTIQLRSVDDDSGEG